MQPIDIESPRSKGIALLAGLGKVIGAVIGMFVVLSIGWALFFSAILPLLQRALSYDVKFGLVL
jgi:ABC-type glucose/galactose transport system permease subunit